MSEKENKFQPFVHHSAQMPEMTGKAVLFGLIFAVLFGTTSIYLALSAGLTTGGSLPIAVVAISLLKRWGRSTNILENNMVQTIGSSGESIASSVAFTVPALIFLVSSGGDRYFNYSQIVTVALIGGMLGILFMIPLRRSLIVKEHGKLRYPEGTACAEVLIAGDKQGHLVKPVFAGATTAIVYWVLMKVLGLWNEIPFLLRRLQNQLYPNATLKMGITPEYLGIGYIIGPRAATQMVVGGLLAWLVFVPALSAWPTLVSWLGAKQAYLFLLDLGMMKPDDLPIVVSGTQGFYLPSMPLPDADTVHRAFVKWTGVGAVVTAGLLTLIKTIPTIVSSVRSAVSAVRDGKVRIALRTERDLPLWSVLLGAAVLLTAIAVLPNLPGRFPWSLLLSALIVVFGFVFVTASCRFVGEVGYSNEPVTPFSFTTVMGACALFITLSWTSPQYYVWIVLIASVVCIAAGNAGATSQDLKTGFLLGATPYKQQIGLLLGVAVSALVVGGTLVLIDQSMPGLHHTIGAPGTKYQAPQASILAMFIKAVLGGKMPWKLMLVGACFAVLAELAGAVSLSVAAGIYLPLSTSMVIFAGGLVRWLVNRKQARVQMLAPQNHAEQELSPGMLYATGMVAGGAIAGMLIGFLHGFVHGSEKALSVGREYWRTLAPWGDYLAVLVFVWLAVGLYRQSQSDPKLHAPNSANVAVLGFWQKMYAVFLTALILLVRGGMALYGLVSTWWFHHKSDGGWSWLSEWAVKTWHVCAQPLWSGAWSVPRWLPGLVWVETMFLVWGAWCFAVRYRKKESHSPPPAEFWHRLTLRTVLVHIGLYALVWAQIQKGMTSAWSTLLLLQGLVATALAGFVVYLLTGAGFAWGGKQAVAGTKNSNSV